jgi:hypothetical protein
MWDRNREGRTIDQPTLFAGDTIPAALKDSLVKSHGPLPVGRDSRYFSNEVQDKWTTSALTDSLWAKGVPTLSVLWLSEPDYAQHGAGPGSATARAGLKSSDECLGKVLAYLDAAKLRDQTDVMVVSDHGFSTVAAGIDIFEDLYDHKFDIAGLFVEKPPKGTVMMVGLGGSVAFYVIEHDKGTIEKLVKHLQTTIYAGVLFTRDGLEGTFKLADAGIDAPHAPDVVMSMRWASDKINREGAMPGLLLIEGKGGYKPGQGMHGSLSRFDMHNTLIAAGPDFKADFKSETPSGNIDVAPTVLSILGIEPKEPMDGRVLAEALTTGDAKPPAAQTKLLEAKRDVDGKAWRQYLKVSTVGKQTYYDEGNAGAPEK